MVVSSTTASANTTATPRSWVVGWRSSQGTITPASTPMPIDVDKAYTLLSVAANRSPEVLSVQ